MLYWDTETLEEVAAMATGSSGVPLGSVARAQGTCLASAARMVQGLVLAHTWRHRLGLVCVHEQFQVPGMHLCGCRD